MFPIFGPSKKAMKSIRSKIRNLTTRRWYRLSLEEIVANLNPVIRGWRITSGWKFNP
ncbi:group II intron, maturase-specific domain protein [Leptospira interrogans serovar Grippotyphosa str. UI 12764]|nr:group II intron, maturase-specific domain protein [Leptospira interrogans serovar Grippotyphosa str. UI 12764]